MIESVRRVLNRNEYRMYNTPDKEHIEIFQKAGEVITNLFEKNSDYKETIKEYLNLTDDADLDEAIYELLHKNRGEVLKVDSVVEWAIINIYKTEEKIRVKNEIINSVLSNKIFNDKVKNIINSIFLEKPLEFESVKYYLENKYGCCFSNLDNKQTLELIMFLDQCVDKSHYTTDDRLVLRALSYIFEKVLTNLRN